MKAKKMFEKIGYRMQHMSKEQIIYRKESRIRTFKTITINNFPKEDRNFYVGYDTEHQGAYVSIEELQAINKKLEELGWFDE